MTQAQDIKLLVDQIRPLTERAEANAKARRTRFIDELRALVEHARGDHEGTEDCAECRAENKARAEELNAQADELNAMAYRVTEIEQGAFDRTWRTTAEALDSLAVRIRAKALTLYCEHADATGIEGEDLWECDDCGAEFIGAEVWHGKAGAK